MIVPIRSILRSGERPPRSEGGGGDLRRGLLSREGTFRALEEPLVFLREELRFA